MGGTDTVGELPTDPGFDWSVLSEFRTRLIVGHAEMRSAQHLVDSGYVSAEQLAKSQDLHAIDLVGPICADGTWQAHADDGFALADFTIQWDQQQAICPQGKVSRQWKPTHTPHGQPTIHIEFAAVDCTPCPVRGKCTRAKRDPRELTIRQHAEFTAMERQRLRQRTPAFQEVYAQRAGIEGTLSQGVRRLGMRHARYQGTAKAHLQQGMSAVALNLLRLDNWLTGVPLARTRASAFARLAAA